MTQSLTFQKSISYKYGSTVVRDDYSVGGLQLRIDQLERHEDLIDLLAILIKILMISIALPLPRIRLSWSLPRFRLPESQIERLRKTGIFGIWVKHYLTLGRLR